MDNVRWFCRGCHTHVDAVVVDERRTERKIRCPDCGDRAIVPHETMEDHLQLLELAGGEKK